MTAPAYKLGSTKLPKVYVVQEPLFKDRSGQIRERFSLDAAKNFGDIAYVLNWSDPAQLSVQEMLWKVRRALDGICQNDYLLMVGNPTAMALAATVAAELTDGCFKVLYWDGVRNEYRVETVDLNAQPL